MRCVTGLVLRECPSEKIVLSIFEVELILDKNMNEHMVAER